MRKASIIFFVTILFNFPSYSETLSGEHSSSSLEARETAYQYSFDNLGVGIVMSYGKNNKVSVKDIGYQFVSEFKKHDIDSKYFYYDTDRNGMGMEFYIGHSAMGAYSVDEAASKFSQIVKRAKAMKNVHTNSTNDILQEK